MVMFVGLICVGLICYNLNSIQSKMEESLTSGRVARIRISLLSYA